MIHVGDVREVVLYRTPTRWRYAVATTTGIVDGSLELPVDCGFEAAARETERRLHGLLHSVPAPLRWSPGVKPDWWTAVPGTDIVL